MRVFDTIHTEISHVHTYDLDPFYRARLPYFFQLMQEAAANHSDIYKLTIQDLLRDHKTWVISRQRITIDRYPHWSEDITIRTWIQKPSRLVAPRAFTATDAEGNPVFQGLAYWCVVDLERRRPIPIAAIADFAGIHDPEYQLGPPIGKPEAIPESCTTTFTCHPHIQYRDTDINGHVNNNSYCEWCLESLPFEIRHTKKPTLFEIHYAQETRIGDVVTVETFACDHLTTFYHRISVDRAGDDIVVCHAKSQWGPRESLL